MKRVTTDFCLGTFREGYQLLKGSMMVFLGITIVPMMTEVVTSVVPILGQLASGFFSVLFTVGIFHCAQEIRQKGEVKFSQLFFAFEDGELFRRLLPLCVTVSGLNFISFSFGIATSFAGVDPLLTYFVTTVVSVFSFLLVFSSLLVSFKGFSAREAVGELTMTGVTNLIPFILYGIVAAVLIVLAALPLLLGLFIMIPVYWMSSYLIFEALFLQEAHSTGK